MKHIKEKKKKLLIKIGNLLAQILKGYIINCATKKKGSYD